MEELKERIKREGEIVSQQVLKLDAILNHQVDPALTMEMGRQFAARFAADAVTKVVTVESSGIPVAFAVAHELGVPMIFARRKKTLLADPDSYVERVPSFTKGIVTDLMLPKRFIKKEDRVLLIDDIIANGDAARGLVRIMHAAEATLVGVGIVVEKCFQPGAQGLRDQGIRLESLVRIQALGEEGIVFAD